MMLPQADVKTFSITLEEQDFKTVLKEKLEILGLTKEKKQKKQETLMEEEKEIKFLESEYKTKESLVLLLKEHNFSHQEISKTLNLTKNQIRYLLRKNEEGKDLKQIRKNQNPKDYSVNERCSREIFGKSKQ